jgi:sec-independent protein translocase protein TatB
VFGLTFEKLLLIGIIAVFIIGPERLPAYTQKFAQFIRQLRSMATGAKDRMKEELGDDFDEIEWKKLDPRQYDSLEKNYVLSFGTPGCRVCLCQI